jgi:hypothetical protein
MKAIDGGSTAVIAALVSSVFGLTGGLFAQIIKGRLDDQATNRRLLLEAALARQKTILDAQSTLLEEVCQSLWKWRYISTQVTYYGGCDHGAGLEESLLLYRKEIWPTLNEIRRCSSTARRLLSGHVYDKLRTFYNDTVIAFGRELEDA